MDEHFHDDTIDKIREISQGVTGVVGTDKCFVRKTGMKFCVDLHITVNSEITVEEGHAIAHQVKKTLIKEIPEIISVLIHVEPDK